MTKSKIISKHMCYCNGIRIGPGMNIEVIDLLMSSPISVNRRQCVINAFNRIDINKTECWSMVKLNVERLN